MRAVPNETPSADTTLGELTSRQKPAKPSPEALSTSPASGSSTSMLRYSSA